MKKLLLQYKSLPVKKNLTERQLNFTKDSDKQLFRKFSNPNYLDHQADILMAIHRRLISKSFRLRELKKRSQRAKNCQNMHLMKSVDNKTNRLVVFRINPLIDFLWLHTKLQLAS